MKKNLLVSKSNFYMKDLSTALNYPHLKKLYKKSFENNTEITEKNIIYFLRNAMSQNYHNDKKRVDKEFYEKEIFDIIKSKDWNWHYTDIDGCNILCYALYNQVDSISDYLIKNKYDLSIYKKNVGQALTASICINNSGYFQKIVNQTNLNEQYLLELSIKAYTMKSFNPSGFSLFCDYIGAVPQTQTPVFFESTIKGILTSEVDFSKFLKVHLMPPHMFIEITEKILNENENFKNIHNKKSVIERFSDYKLFYKLNEDLQIKKPKPLNKI